MRSLVSRGATAIDLGAHKGAYAYWLARAVGRTGRVVCVEAQPGLAEKLKIVMRAFPQVSVKWAAISDRSGSATLATRGDGSSHGASLKGFGDGKPVIEVEVPTLSLADLAAEFGLGRVDFVKCDIEGHEVEMFAGAMDFIREHRPSVLVECEQRHAWDAVDDRPAGVDGLVSLFEAEGYRVRFFQGGTLHPVDEFDAATHQNYGVGEYCNNFLLEPAK